MILSSADIARILGGDAIIRQEAVVSIVDGRAPLGTEEKVYIYIDKYPSVDEFEATWRVRVVDSASDFGDLVRQSMKSVLPRLEPVGLDYLVKDFRSASTETRPEPSKAAQMAESAANDLKESFSRLEQDIQDRMLLVNSGRPGKDGRDGVDGPPGRDGRDGVDGQDGKDLVATDAELFDLKDVDQSILPVEKGQVLTWDGSKWTNLFVRQTMSAGGAAGGGSNTEPDDGLGGIVNAFWKFDDEEDEAYADGKFRVNSHQGKTDWSLATEVYLAYKDDDGKNTKNYILQLIKPGQYLYIQRNDRPDAYAIFLVEAVPVDADLKGARIAVTFMTQGADIGDITKDKLCALTFTLVSGSGGAGGATTLAELTDTNVAGAVEGELLVYRSGVWTSETAPATGLQPGDNVSELVNDAGYITLADVPSDAPVDSVNGQTGVVVLDADDIDDTLTAHKFATAAQLGLADTSVQPGDNISDLTNDAGYITLAEVPVAPVTSVAGKTGEVTLVKADITDFSDADYATAAQGSLADTALQSGDNVSELVNDAGYLTQIPGTLFTGRYRYEANTALTPGAAVVRFDSTIYTSVTQIAFSKIDKDGRDTSEFLNDIVQPGFTVYFEQQGSSDRAVKFLITSFGANNPGNVIWNVDLVSETGVALTNNNDVVTQFESAPVTQGIEEAPQDGNYYVRQNGAWVNLADALTALNDRTIDGGDFNTGSSAGYTEVVDGGNFS